MQVVGGENGGKKPLEDHGVDERIILKWNFRKRNGEQGLDFGGSGAGPAFACCESCNEN